MGDYKKGGICILVGIPIIVASIYWMAEKFFAPLTTGKPFTPDAAFVCVLVSLMVGLIMVGIGGALIRRKFWGGHGFELNLL